MESPGAMARVVKLLSRLPGVGRRSATRMVLQLLDGSREHARELAQALEELVEKVQHCSTCYTYTETDPCEVCGDARRDRGTICVVQSVQDLLAIERTGEYRGIYHVLHGVISPLDGVGPGELRIGELVSRVGGGGVGEVIVATNPSVEGESTGMYVRKLLTPLGVRVTRIASGVPMGSDLEYSDRATLGRALTGRTEL